MLRLRLTLVLVFTVFVALPVLGAPTTTRSSTRVRPHSPRVATWFARGLQRSSTMRALADRVEQSDVVVYLEIAFRLDPGMAACVTWMASAPGARYLRVSMRANLREADAIAMLAHELQHVVEVIDSPEVQSGADLAALYARIGHRTGSGGRTWDTVAALRAGELARGDLVRGT
jgi:hypothetical protein